MQQMLCYGVAGIFLTVCVWEDIRKRTLSWQVLLGGVVGAVIVNGFFLSIWQNLFLLAGALAAGGGLFMLAFVSRQRIGYGDALLLGVLGLYLPFRETVSIFLLGLFFSAFGGILLLICKKGNKKLRLPFAPFLMTAFLLGGIMQWK